MGELEGAIVGFLGSNPKLAVLLTVIGVLRAVFKPLMTVIDVYVQSTPSTEDDSKWAAIKATKWYKWAAWVIDYFMSIKLPTSK
jgi:hypothetical protein